MLHVESSSVPSVDVALTGEGIVGGDLLLTPAAGSFADFGGLRLGATAQAVFTLTNPSATASGPLDLRSNRPEFTLLPPTGAAGECVIGATSLVNGESCTVRLAFTPTERGSVEATLSSRSEGAGSVSATLKGRGLAPGVLVPSVAAVDFAGVVVGEGAQRSVRFENGGDEPLTVVGSSLLPAGAEGFAIKNSDCGAGRVVAAGEGCLVQLEFRPPRVGEELSVTLQTQAAEGQQTQSIAVKGTGLQSGPLLVAAQTPGEEDFGNVLLESGVVRVFQVTNPVAQPSGVLTLSASKGFEIEAPPAPGECGAGTSIVDSASCTVRVRFAPARRDSYRGALTVSSALVGAKSLPLIGRGIVAAALKASDEIDFGQVFTNASASRTLSVRNVGDEPLPPPSLELTSTSPELVGAFSYESGCVTTLAPSGSCDVVVRLSPTQAVPHSANLRITARPGGTAAVLLLADALAPGTLVLAAATGGTNDFGDVPIGAATTQQFTVTNPGPVPSGRLTILSSSNRFTVQEGDCNPAGTAGLADGTSCTFSVQFTPDSSVDVVANLAVQSLGAGQAGLEIRGRGRNGANLVATANRDLGRANIGQAELTQPENQFTWTVTNEGDLPSGVLSVTNDNMADFVISDDTCSAAVVPGGGTCTMSIRFQPSDIGTRTGTIAVIDAGSARSTAILLTAVGQRLVQLGESCINATCAEGECTAGVCCDRPCDGTCQVCSAAGVCTDQSGQETCGNGDGRCFGVNRCLLPNGEACGQGSDCGNGNCEQRLNGQGVNDRICCQQDCDALGQQCNAQGQCQLPTLAAGTLCGGAGDAPCSAGLECKSCLDGARRCTPPAECCGGCTAPYVCIDGDSCGCPLQPGTTQRQLDCGGGLCVQNRANACCPATPDCPAALPNCDSSDNLCKQCVNATQCAGTNRACNGGVCACALGNKDCGGGRCIANNACCEDCTGGRTCINGTCGCPNGQTFVNGQCVLPQGATCQVNGTPCATGQCVDGVCCESLCQGLCTQCQAGTGRCIAPASDINCPPVTCGTSDACRSVDAVGGNCRAPGECKTEDDCSVTNEPARTPCSQIFGIPGCSSASGPVDCQTASLCDGSGSCNLPVVSCNGVNGLIGPNNCCSVGFPDGDVNTPLGFSTNCDPGGSGSLTVLCDNNNDCPAGTECCLHDNGNFNILGCRDGCGEDLLGRLLILCASPGGGTSACPAGRSCTITSPNLPDTWRFCTNP